MCKLISGTYYIHDGLLKAGGSVLDASFELGYHIALEAKTNHPDLHFDYMQQKNSVGYSIKVKETTGPKVLVELSDSLFACSPTIRMITTNKQHETIDLPSSEVKCFVHEVKRATDYRFEAIDSDENIMLDPLTKIPCSATLSIESLNTDSKDFDDKFADEELVSSRRYIEDMSTTEGCDDDDDPSCSGLNDFDDYDDEFSDEELVSSRRYIGGMSTTERCDDYCDLECDDDDDSSCSNFSHDDDNSTKERARKRSRQESPRDMEEITLEGRVFRLGNHLVNNENWYYTILHFDGKKRPTNTVAEIVRPLGKTYVGEQGDQTFDGLWAKSVVTFKSIFLLRLKESSYCIIPEAAFLLDSSADPKKASYSFFSSYERLSPVEAPQPCPSSPRTLDLFAGIGGMSTGLAAAGFDVLWQVEKDTMAAASLNHSHPDAKAETRRPVYVEDVNFFLDCAEKGDSGYPTKDDVDHIHASPPCQGFSTANRSGGKHDESNRSLTSAFVRAVRTFRPLTATMENVPGILLSKNNAAVRGIMRDMLILGYHIRIAVHTASDFGDPQKRKRVFLYASLNGMALIGMPHRTHLENPVSVKDVLSDLEDIPVRKGCGIVIVEDTNGGLKKIMNHTQLVPPDQVDRCLKADDVALTLTTQTTFGHYKHDRSVSVREYAKLQSFPDEQQFFGSTGNMRRQIGNAVPVKMATAVAKTVMAAYKHDLPDTTESPHGTAVSDDSSTIESSYD
jgi:DNA (cytosine-5)-methyltransferase 1